MQTRKKMTSKSREAIHKATIKNEIIGVSIIFFGVLLLYSKFFKDSGIVGSNLNLVTTFLFGTIGVTLLGIICVLTGLYITLRFKPFEDLASVLFILGIVVNILTLLHISDKTYKLVKFYDVTLYENILATPTKGGVIGVLLSNLYTSLLSSVGAYILVIFLTIIFLLFIFKDQVSKYSKNLKVIRQKDIEEKEKIRMEKLDQAVALRGEKIRQRNNKVKNQKAILTNPYESKTVKEDLDFEKFEKEDNIEKIKKQEKIKIYNANNEEPKVNAYKVNKASIRKNELKKEEDFISKKIKSNELKDEAYIFPPFSLLKSTKKRNDTASNDEIMKNASLLEKTLLNFSIGAKVNQITVGPTVTRYELQLEPGIRVSRVVNLSDDIALSLAAKRIRIEAPIPGKSAIGIEVPNKEISPVLFKDIAETEAFNNAPSNISVALGKNLTGDPLVMDIAKLPHLLIAGATGSGKSVCVNTIINSLLYHADPKDVKLILIDPKMVELNIYNGIPHLMIPVVTDPKQAAGALNWAIKEMKIRYERFVSSKATNITEYNETMIKNEEETLAQIVIIIDELADLMMICAKEVESAISRLAQLARAAGIHLILATQRPSVDVITGLIKANIPSRISFAVSSSIDSRTILDMSGAEKLLGNGDMLYFPAGHTQPTRAQCSFISRGEVESIVNFIKKKQKVTYDKEIVEEVVSTKSEFVNTMANSNETPEGTDTMLNDAIKVAFEIGSISTSMVQRRLRVGYARAGRIVDEMEAMGIISGADGSKPRKLLMKYEDFFKQELEKESEE